MKKSIFICAALALAASVSLSSCQKEQGPATDDGVKSIALSINFGQSGTKAVIDGELDDAWSDKYKEYKSLDLFFTNSKNNVLYYYHATPDAEAESNGKIIWDGLTSGTAAAGAGVRFLGMEGINRVFVVANAPALTIATDEYGKVNGTSFTMSQLNDMLVLKDYAADKDQNLMIYAGATFSLEPVAGAISDQAGVIEVVEDPEAGQDYQANITIRPAVSRIEISNVAVQTEGDVYFAEDTDGTYVPSDETNGIFRVHYTGFNPTLVGVYASNVYRTSPLFPQQTDVTAGNLFATPSQIGAIAAGAWTDLASEADFNDCLCYANYESGNYGSLVSGTYSGGTSGEYLEVFNGDGSVIPFNFFVPYDITSTADATGITALADAAVPALHFQFKEPASPMTLTAQYKNGGSWTDVTDEDIKKALTSYVDWPSAVAGEDGIGFANVVTYYEDDYNGATRVTLRPGYVYQVKQVRVTPVNIDVTTQQTNAYNVYVVVTVVPYTTQPVYPGFE